MAYYVVKEMPAGMGNGKKGRIFPKMQVYTEFDYDKHGFITLQDYANLNRLSRSAASRELSKLVADPNSGIKTKGAGSHKVWV